MWYHCYINVQRQKWKNPGPLHSVAMLMNIWVTFWRHEKWCEYVEVLLDDAKRDRWQNNFPRLGILRNCEPSLIRKMCGDTKANACKKLKIYGKHSTIKACDHIKGSGSVRRIYISQIVVRNIDIFIKTWN